MEPDNYALGAIMAGDYAKALAHVSNGSGDLHVMALLAIAKELQAIRRTGLDVATYPRGS
jgi:hypothetical protein